jgi:23S rRNA pseudouridine1911/1915/1917 synthase
MSSQARFCVRQGEAGRLDRYLAQELQLSRTAAARLIAQGRVRVGGRAVRASFVPQPGVVIEVDLPEVQPRRIRPAPIPLNIVYEDEELAVVDKPAGLVVHPAPGHWDDTLLNALAARGVGLAGGPEGRAGIVHRLDRDTSGLLVVAKTDRAHRRLSRDLAARRIQRRYAVLSWGHLGGDERRVEAPVARHPVDRKKMRIARHGEGRPAATVFRTVARGLVADLLLARLETGRTHQIRVHLASIGHPAVGDAVYGPGFEKRSDATRERALALARATPRQALHAAALRLVHPTSGRTLDLVSEWPLDLRPALALALGEPSLLADAKPLQYLGFYACGVPDDRA